MEEVIFGDDVQFHASITKDDRLKIGFGTSLTVDLPLKKLTDLKIRLNALADSG